MNTTLFTPRHFETGERPAMQISDEDEELFKTVAEDNVWVEVYDHTSNARYLVRSADCGLNCRCDAVYREV